MSEDNRSQQLKDADELLKTTDVSIKDDMLYFIARHAPEVFAAARQAAF